ncbi:MAG: hypothetical protein ACYDB9_08265 [Gammaproteobacteria bacterium]
MYTWDGYGNLTERQDANQNLRETFRYDDLNRLTKSSVTNPNHNGPSLSLAYDALGNIQSHSNLGTYAYAPHHPDAVASGEIPDRLGVKYAGRTNLLPHSNPLPEGEGQIPFDFAALRSNGKKHRSQRPLLLVSATHRTNGEGTKKGGGLRPPREFHRAV